MPPKRVLIVGGGAAGMSCAATLANHPSQFTVTVLERESFVGGQATSASLDSARYGADFLNDGVQGGSEIFGHTFRFFKMMGYEATEVKLQISFGKGKEGFWSNVFPSNLVQEFQSDIKKFGKVLKIVHYLEIVFALVPVWLMLRIFFFSKGFGDRMVYPLMALFLGTGSPVSPEGTYNRESNSVCVVGDIGEIVFGSEYEVVGLLRQDTPSESAQNVYFS
jgi:hypothetical protein